MSISTGPFENPAVMIITPIIVEAYKRLKIDTKIINSSWSRSLLISSNGESDAGLFRTKMVSELYGDLIIVNEPILFLDMVIFTKSDKIKIKSWSDLSKYRVAFLRGVKVVEKNTKDYNIYPVNTLERAFELLDKDRVDIVIEEHFNGLLTIKTMGLKAIITQVEPIERIPVYHYIHSSKRYLVPLVEKELRGMTLDGTTDKIISEVSSFILKNY